MAGIARAREESSISSPATGFVRLRAATDVAHIADGTAISRAPVVVGFRFAMMAFSSMIGNVTLSSLRQRLIPDDLPGRVTSACRMFAIGAVSAGAAAGGLLAREFTLTTPGWLAGFGMPANAAAMLRVLNNRAIRRTLESGIRR